MEDQYFQDYVNLKLKKKNDFEDGVNDLLEGAGDLKDGLSELNENSDKVTDGANKILKAYLAQANSVLSGIGIPEILTGDNYEEILDKYYQLTKNESLTELKRNISEISEFEKKINEYTDGVSEAYDGSVELYDGIEELKEESDKIIDEYFEVDIDNLVSFIEAKDNPRIKAGAQDIEMNKSVGLLAGVVVMILFTYVISVFVIHQIQNESSVIGTLYAMGATNKDLFRHYITLPTIITFIAGIIGTLIGFSKFGTDYQLESSYAYYSLPKFDKLYPIYLIVYGVIMPPVVSVIVNYFTINRKLSCTALSLIRNEQKETKISGIDLGKMKFMVFRSLWWVSP